MYNGYVESEEKVQARKARILAGYKPARRTRKQSKPAPVALDRPGWALAIKRQQAG